MNGQFTTPTPDTATDADLLARWAALDLTGDPGVDLTHEDYDRLAVIAPEGAAYVEDCRAAAISADALPPRGCKTCGGEGFVEVRTTIGGWHWGHGPQLDITDEPCPDCRPSPADLDDDAFDAYMAGAYTAAVAL